MTVSVTAVRAQIQAVNDEILALFAPAPGSFSDGEFIEVPCERSGAHDGAVVVSRAATISPPLSDAEDQVEVVAADLAADGWTSTPSPLNGYSLTRPDLSLSVLLLATGPARIVIRSASVCANP